MSLHTVLKKLLSAGMISALGIASITGLTCSFFITRFQGFNGLSSEVLHTLEIALVYLIAWGITTEAFINGGHSAREEWTSLWRRLVLYLTVALAMRGIAVALAAQVVGIKEVLMVAAGLTATDPAAVGIALALAKGGHSVKTATASFAWLASIESMLNDGEGLVLFEFARHTTISIVLLALFHTFLLAFLIASADAWTRWAIRNLGRATEFEPYLEVGLVCFIYILGFYIGYHLGISAILTAAVAAVLANWWMHLLQPERDYRQHERIRQNLNDLWSQVGLGGVFAVAVAVIPYTQFVAEPLLLAKAAVLLLSIALSRVLFEFIGVFYNATPRFPWGSALIGVVSVGTSTCLLGVPTVVGIALAAHGHQEDANLVFATILLSWTTVWPTVKFMQWVDRKLEVQTL